MFNWVKRKKWLVVNTVLAGLLVSLLGIQLVDRSDVIDRSVKIGVGNEKVITLGSVAYAAGSVDYAYDGTDDDVQFQAALDALPVTGGRLVDVSAVQKNFSTTVARAIDNVIIEGAGDGSYFTNNGVTTIFDAGVQNGWVFRNFRTDAGFIDVATTADYIIENVTNDATLVGKTVRTATLVVAASDSSESSKAQADYVANGVADNVEIQAAIDVLPNTGGKIILSEGTFVLATSINITYSHTLEGAGKGATIITGVAGEAVINIAPVDGTYVYPEGASFRNFKTSGGKYGLYFGTYAGQSLTENVIVQGASDFGIYISSGSGWGNTFVNVMAFNNGMASVDTGGLYLDTNQATFTGSKFDANGTGIILAGGYNNSFFGTVVEGNNYHGVWGKGTAQFVTFNNVCMETNNNVDAANIYDFLIEESAAYWTISDFKLTGTKVTKSIQSSANNMVLISGYAGGAVSLTGSFGQIIQSNITSPAITGTQGEQTNRENRWLGYTENKYIRMVNSNPWAQVAPEGGVVIYRAAGGDNHFSASQVTGDAFVLGVASSNISNTASGYIQIAGKTTKLKVNGTDNISIGDWLGTSGTLWIASKVTTGNTAFAIAREAYTEDDDNGVIDALIISPRVVP